MEIELAKRIRVEKEQPLIAVIGATLPTEEYKKEMGMGAGYALRKYIDNRRGTLFTGGVDGVGVDVYTGIMRYCIDKLESCRFLRKMPDDRFFVLVPAFDHIRVEQDSSPSESRYIIVRFEVPEAYRALGVISEGGKLNVVTAGSDMEERRNYLAEIADVLITINGGMGTLDEAITANKNRKPVITLSYSGGAASLLHSIKDPSYVPLVKPKEVQLISRMGRYVNPDLIHVASDTQEMIRHLDLLLK